MSGSFTDAPCEASPFRDPRLPVSERVTDLVRLMTLAEKVGQMLQLDAREDLDYLVRTKLAGSLLHASPERMIKARRLTAQTRLRIPLLMAEDCIHGHSFWPGATIFPTQLAMACTWDPALVEKCARAAAVEISATGLHWTFSPVLCISRDLRWGRVGETFGEDPFLIGELGAAAIRGYHGSGLADRTAVLATAKHFAGYSETQGGRDASEADLTRRKLRSWFLPPFQKAVETGCRTFMLGYQAIDGVPVTANRWLLHDVLREEWGFQGMLVTDWDNVGRMVWEQRVCADYVDAAVVAVQAGNDLVMTTPRFFESAQVAVEQGILDEKHIDEAVKRILRLKFELGLFEDPRAPDPSVQALVIGSGVHRELNLEAARRSLVLLQNDGLLPFDGGLSRGQDGRAISATARRIVVTGPLADDPHGQLGDWAGASGQVNWMPEGHPRALTTTIVDGIREIAPPGWTVEFRPGAAVGELVPNPAGETYPDGQPRPRVFVPAQLDPALIADVTDALEGADLVIAVVGDTVALTGESKSTATLELQGSQIALLEALSAAGVPYVVVLVQSKPSVLPTAAVNAPALIQAFNPGMMGGRAIAELLLGISEPSGRLPISVAMHAGQIPVYYNQIRGQHGDRYADLTQEPQFAFGYGLSYTNVEYSSLRIERTSLGPGDFLVASVSLTNTGARPALETVQAYISDVVTSTTWADRELKWFTQVEIPPDTTVDVTLSIAVSGCTIVDTTGRRVVEQGQFELLVGPNSRREDLLAASFTIIKTTFTSPGDPPPPPGIPVKP